MQKYEVSRTKLVEKFEDLKQTHPQTFEHRLNLSWSNWGFGIEPLETSVKRLSSVGLNYIELHGNHYGDDLGYDASETTELLESYDMKVSGVCGMFSESNDLSSNNPVHQQRAIEYIRREIQFTKAMGGEYLLVVPAAVGRPVSYDAFEWDRSVEALKRAGDMFTQANVKGAIEPIRGDEVSIVHSVADAMRYIDAVDHPGIQHINGDVYHMQSAEWNIAEAILAAGDRLLNLHLADSNRLGLGSGSMDLDSIIMALYVIGYNVKGRFVTPEPLGPGGSPYVARNGRIEESILDALVADSVKYFREREDELLS